MGESGEDVSADAEVGSAHVGTFFGTFEGEGDTAEVGGSHFGFYKKTVTETTSPRRSIRVNEEADRA